MTSVHFKIHRCTSAVEELDEQTIAQLLAEDQDFVSSLVAQEEIEGAIVIGDAAILDDLNSATQRLCLEGPSPASLI